MLDGIYIFKDVIKRLNENGVPYMVSGSVAMNYYSIPRMTRDLDIVVEIDDPDRFYDAFKDKYYIDKSSVLEAIKNKSIFNIIHLEELMKVDFIIKKGSHYRKKEFTRRKKVMFEDFFMYIVSIEYLIISKLLWAKESHSEQQIKDVGNLLDEKLDMKYLTEWLKRLNIYGFYKEIESDK